ncbi:MAG: iron uptake porin [Cyanobacteria bacterium J06643_13]
MLRMRGLVCQIIPILGAWLLFMSNVEALPESKNSENSFDWQNKSNLKNTSRQSGLLIYESDAKAFKSVRQKYLAQVNRVQDLRDIQPTDWSYQALQNLIERYGCISGFPDSTYRGERGVSRAEFIAGLNSCLNSIEERIAQTENVPQADIDTLLRLMQEFQSELAILQGRTDGAQARLQDLEATQFSSTTKLQGEAVFAGADILSAGEASTVLGYRLRLDLSTSFRGDDLLFTRLSTGNFTGFAEEIDTFQGDLAFVEDEGLRLENLHYSGNIGDRLDFIIGAVGLEADDIAPTINFLDGDGGSGAISRFATRNPLYYPPGEAGLGITHSPIDQIKITAGYVAGAANESSPGSGLFDGPYSALGQITVSPFDSLTLAATYVHSFNQSDTETGTNAANLQSLTADLFGESVPTVSNSYGLELSWAISDRFILGGWGGLSKVNNLSTLGEDIDRGTQDIWNWAATLAIPDLGKEGSLAGIVVGSEPKVTDSTIANLEADSDRSLHLEAFYQYQVNDNIAITPGVVWITEPDSATQNGDDLVIGTVRTTFSF